MNNLVLSLSSFVNENLLAIQTWYYYRKKPPIHRTQCCTNLKSKNVGHWFMCDTYFAMNSYELIIINAKFVILCNQIYVFYCCNESLHVHITYTYIIYVYILNCNNSTVIITCTVIISVLYTITVFVCSYILAMLHS